MKKSSLHILIFLLLMITQALAKDLVVGPEPVSEAKLPDKKTFTLEAGFIASYWSYIEYSRRGTQLMKDSGPLYGIGLGIEKFISKFYLQAQTSYLMGKTQYDGHLVYFDQYERPIRTTSYQSDSKNTIMQLRGLLGVALYSDNIEKIIFKSGFQFRRLNNPDQADDPYDYDRQATYWTVPMGMAWQRQFNAKWSFTGDFLVHAFFNGETESHGRGEKAVFQQEDGYGLEFALKWSRAFKAQGIAFGPFFQYWSIQDSKGIPLGNGYERLEPKNKTNLIGLMFSAML